ncbi:type I toxin-antitoxin system SymE family toxin [Luteimonas sp. Y-2-2-4F]|nr:type I toxin-antitoxin system SymE family toxin [Luteimonas sp. Y-2-2-4F]
MSEPTARRKRPLRDLSPLAAPDWFSETFTPPPTEEERRRLANRPRSRTPVRCTMGYQYYDEWQGEQMVGCAVPKLRLSGRWLAEHGFEVGDDLQVSVGQGVLLISRRPKVG